MRRVFGRTFRDTPLWRPKRRGMLRNAAIILGNQRSPTAVPALVRGLNDDEPLVREASARGPWGESTMARHARLWPSVPGSKRIPAVRTEIAAALSVC